MATKNDKPKCEYLSHQDLLKYLYYDENTGIFIWNIAESRSIKIGDEAGTISTTGYIQIRINRISYQAHRLAWYYVHKSYPKNHIDHINGIRTDNRIFNLRDVTQSENNKNQRLAKNNSSGVSDVTLRNTGKWYARLSINGIRHSLYHGDDFFQAVCARKSAENFYNYHKNHGSILE